MLEKLKRDNKAKSLDEAIQMMIRQVKRPKKSMFGAFKDLPEFKREELDRFD